MAQREVRIKTVEDGIDGAPPWITTFVDMTSLLVTFFILLFTFSSITEYDAFSMPGRLLGMSGIMHEDPADSVSAPESDIMKAYDVARGAKVPHSRPLDQLLENLEEMGQKDDDAHQPLDLRRVGAGLRIDFADEASFAPGSATVNAELGRSMKELASTLASYPYVLLVEGFVDNGFRPTPQFPDGRSLSLARARAAAEALSAAGLPSLRIQVAGRGHAPQPGNTGESVAQRRAQRRVEVRILPGTGSEGIEEVAR